MKQSRRFLGAGFALMLVIVLTGLIVLRAPRTGNARRQAASAAERLERSLERSGDTTRAIALAYLERARLGLGSPFRLIEQAIRDPRLPASIAHDVSWSIVGRILADATYEIDPKAFDLISQPGTGSGHLQIIEDEIAGADDPRVAEASLRIAYGLAAANGTTGMTSLPVIAEAIAQVRDRALAERDLRRAIPRASEDGVDLIDELIHLRTTRELSVEQPMLAPRAAGEREEAIERAPGILARIESVVPDTTALDRPSLLDRSAAMTLAAVSARQPPLAAMRVAVTGRVATLRADSALPRQAIPVVGAAANEEALVAAYAFADQLSEGRSASLRRLMVSAGVALRAHAQDKFWASDNAVNAGFVARRFGLKAITFEPAVPREWRTFYVRLIASGLEDFMRAVPRYNPAGLSFRVEMSALPDSALAMHDPRTHTIRLSALTPTGTLAHELAHDMDWQAARRLFTKTGGYATDRSIRDGSIKLATSVRGLTSARIAGRGRISPHGSTRPAEVFARSADWFVSDALAAVGRSNGYLSAIQDPLFAGFATAPSDAPALESASALVRTLGEMAQVPDSAGAGYLARWSSVEAMDPVAVILRAMDTPVISRRTPRIPFGFSASMMTDLATGGLCRVDAMRDGTPQERLVAMAIDARAKGIVIRRARYMPAAERPAWARAALGDPLVPAAAADEINRRTAASVAEGLARAGLMDFPPAPFRPLC